MKKKEKTVCQIIRFRGNIDTFLVSIEKFARFNIYAISLNYLHTNISWNVDKTWQEI